MADGNGWHQTRDRCLLNIDVDFVRGRIGRTSHFILHWLVDTDELTDVGHVLCGYIWLIQHFSERNFPWHKQIQSCSDLNGIQGFEIIYVLVI